MKITDLAQHLHQIRHNRSGRTIGGAMNVIEVWNGVLESDRSSIDEIRVIIQSLPRPVDGMFARMIFPDKELAAIYVDADLPSHWRDFVIIKEMMHCFTSMDRYSSTPKETKSVLNSLVKGSGRYTLNVAADDVAILAAAEVILPHKTILSLQALNLDVAEIASRHNLHHEVAEEICRVDLIKWRQKATINGDF